MKQILTLALFIITLPAFAQTASGNIQYTKGKYSISYPDSWTIDTSAAPRVDFVLLSPKENDDDRFSENVNLMLQDLTGKNMDLDQFAAFSEQQIKAHATDLKDYTSRKIVSGKRTYYELSLGMTYNSRSLLSKQYYFMDGETAVVLTYTCEAGKSEEIQQTGQRIMDSFIYKTE